MSSRISTSTKFYISNIDRNVGTALKDAESYQVLMFLSRSLHVRPWWPDKCQEDGSTSRQVFYSITGVTVSQAAVIQ
jgi:hypothetical protein